MRTVRAASHRFDASHDSWEPKDHVSVNLAAAFRKENRQQTSVPEPRRHASDLLRVNSDEVEEEAKQLRLLVAYLESCGGTRDMVDG